MMKLFPEGCAGCNGACCYTPGGVPPYQLTVAPGDRCSALMADGRCELQVNKPSVCTEIKVNGEACLISRAEHGNT